MNTAKDERIGRRDLMKGAIAAIGALIGAAIGVPAIPFVVGPALRTDETEWIRLGSVAKVEMGTPTLFKTTIETQTGWISSDEELSAYVLTENGQDFVAMSNVCTHLGCRVRWVADQNGFFCPCHNGVFSKDGSVVSGPPPRPLDRYDTKIEDGTILVKRG